MIKLCFPVNYVALTQKYSSTHKAIDLGWNRKFGGCNQDIIAPADGTVYKINDGKVNGDSTGNYISINHGKNLYTRSYHCLKGSFKVKVGETVKQGQVVAKMGNSGQSNGNHNHFQVYDGGYDAKYCLDPLKVTYLYPTQSTNGADELLKYEDVNLVEEIKQLNNEILLKSEQNNTLTNEIKLLDADLLNKQKQINDLTDLLSQETNVYTEVTIKGNPIHIGNLYLCIKNKS